MDATWLGMVGGFLTSVAVVPQVVRTWRTKHARDLSIWQPLLLTVGMLLWLGYGLAIGDLPLILANSFSLACYLLLIGLKIRYDLADKAARNDYSISMQYSTNTKEEP